MTVLPSDASERHLVDRAGGRRAPWSAVLIVAVLAGVGVSGCKASALDFVADQRVHFTAPRSRVTRSLPVTLRWTIHDFMVAGPGTGKPSARRGYFALFVDRAPVPPGKTLRAVASGDENCMHTAGCPDQAYLASRSVYTTTHTTFTLTELASLNGGYKPSSQQHKQLHQVTIVLLDTAGRRIGESAWSVEFWLQRSGSS